MGFPENNMADQMKLEENFTLKKCDDLINCKMNNLISRSSSTSLDRSLEMPPFESPTIVEILLNFCLYKYKYDRHQLKIAMKITVVFLQHFNSWQWIIPGELVHLKIFPHCNSYEYYYQRYVEFCRRSSSKPNDNITMAFGQDVLRYTLNVFRNYLANLLNMEAKTWTNSKKSFFLKLLPNFLNLLEEEVYATNSPIWIWNLKEMYNEYINIPSNKNEGTSASRESKNKRIVSINPIEVLTNIDISNSGIQNILEALNDMNLKQNYITYSKGFLTSPQKRHIRILQRLKDQYPVIKLYKSNINLTTCLLWHEELKKIYRSRLPRIPDRYMDRLESDKNIQTMVMLENDLPIGAIFFRPYVSECFTEMVLCIFKKDLHIRKYESRLMIAFKHHNVKLNIHHVFACIEKYSVGYLKYHHFCSEVGIYKPMYDKYIKQYTDTLMMHCNLIKLRKSILQDVKQDVSIKTPVDKGHYLNVKT